MTDAAALGRLYLDTNVFIALKEGGSELAALLVDMVAVAPVIGPPFLVTSELTLAELLPKPYSERRDDLVDHYDGLMQTSSWLEVGPVVREVLWYAAVPRSRHRDLKLPDAIHIATALGLGCTHVLTGDTRLPRSIELVHFRYGMVRGPISLEVLNLDGSTVAAIIEGLRR